MPIRTPQFFFVAILLSMGCGDEGVTEPLIQAPLDQVEALVAGRVIDGSGNPVDGATVEVSLDCSSELDPGCLVGTSVATDSEGRFAASVKQEQRIPYPVRASVRVTPGAGDGYLLGRAEVEGLDAAFQAQPVADTTFVEVVLPPNAVDSRRPVRIQSVGHRSPARPLLVDEERVYLSNPSGVAAMDQATGSFLWQKGESAGLAGLPYVVVGGIVAMAREVTLTAVRADAGEVLWTHDGLPNGMLTVSESNGLYATDGSSVVAYDLDNGALRWSRDLIGSGNVLLSASDAMVCAEILAYVECWDASTGDRLWSRPIDFADWLLVTDEQVISGSQTGWSAFDARTGGTLWENTIESFSAPAISDDDRLAFACSSSTCTAIGMDDGRIAWSVSFDGRIGAPAVGGDSVYVTVSTETRSTLLVLDATTGAVRERILPDPYDGEFSSRSPVIGTEFVFLFGGFGNLYVFERVP